MSFATLDPGSPLREATPPLTLPRSHPLPLTSLKGRSSGVAGLRKRARVSSCQPRSHVPHSPHSKRIPRCSSSAKTSAPLPVQPALSCSVVPRRITAMMPYPWLLQIRRRGQSLWRIPPPCCRAGQMIPSQMITSVDGVEQRGYENPAGRGCHYAPLSTCGPRLKGPTKLPISLSPAGPHQPWRPGLTRQPATLSTTFGLSAQQWTALQNASQRLRRCNIFK